MTAIIDYGLGNLGSIQNMLDVIGENAVITSDAEQIEKAERLILPGVGAFDAGMKLLEEKKLIPVITAEAVSGKPVLGICLGMQLLGKKSEEGKLSGLDLIPFESKKFAFGAGVNLKIPHMGWDIVTFKQSAPLTEGFVGTQRYYFVHSYHAVCDSEKNILMSCDYGYEFTAAVVNKNVYGVQFHPEKSHDFGMALLKNFVEKC